MNHFMRFENKAVIRNAIHEVDGQPTQSTQPTQQPTQQPTKEIDISLPLSNDEVRLKGNTLMFELGDVVISLPLPPQTTALLIKTITKFSKQLRKQLWVDN